MIACIENYYCDISDVWCIANNLKNNRINNILIYYFYFQERISLIVPWIVGLITFMALEAVAIVYSNVLRDHVNKVCNNII